MRLELTEPMRYLMEMFYLSQQCYFLNKGYKSQQHWGTIFGSPKNLSVNIS